ncbi:MAG: hypothetical protein A3F10_02150 [Coxiella sp. RIFCSPHIGHO2_12_FULL_42_15]|nr:MAG: hypothetical protein A3F10_02150 [Coxiella sp. RIFCSPHIGHO2_12_FULL_42_15]
MSRAKDDIDFDDMGGDSDNALEITPDQEPSDPKTKQKIRIEKHSRLVQYFEDKQLREDLEFIDGW